MHPNKQNFVNGLQLILDKWTALKLAIEMEWGGPFTAQKAQDFHYSLIDYFEKGLQTLCKDVRVLIYLTIEGKNIEPEDIEDILLEVMRDEFGAVLEDESEREVTHPAFLVYFLVSS